MTKIIFISLLHSLILHRCSNIVRFLVTYLCLWLLHIPQLEGAIERCRQQILKITSEAGTRHFVFVAGERSQKHTGLSLMTGRPNLNLAIVATGDHQAPLLLKFDVRDKLIVRQNCMYDAFLAKVPYLDCIIVASSCNLVAIW